MNKQSIILLGYLFSFGFLLLSIYTFTCAYLNPSKTVTVAINLFKEQYFDIVGFVFILSIATSGLYFTIKDYLQTKKSITKVQKKLTKAKAERIWIENNPHIHVLNYPFYKLKRGIKKMKVKLCEKEFYISVSIPFIIGLLLGIAIGTGL